MECPQCNYQHGQIWVNTDEEGYSGDLKTIEGNKGDFYESPVRMNRPHELNPMTSEKLFACPSCGIAFLDI